ncbi:MAG TPA: hypothetical protein VE673_14980 [Pseudonocardiaceae bacterium]|nr:hypothetical protein [Pseudonocardiaceae bacterium]
MVRPLDRPCDDEPVPPAGSELGIVAGAVLCVVGVVCALDAEPLDVPGAVLCVVGVGCGAGVACGAGVVCTLGVPVAVSCGAGADGGEVVPSEWVPWFEMAPDDGELPRSPCGAAG